MSPRKWHRSILYDILHIIYIFCKMQGYKRVETHSPIVLYQFLEIFFPQISSSFSAYTIFRKSVCQSWFSIVFYGIERFQGIANGYEFIFYPSNVGIYASECHENLLPHTRTYRFCEQGSFDIFRISPSISHFCTIERHEKCGDFLHRR